MNLSSAELKRLARGTLTGKYSVPMGATVSLLLLIFLVQLPFRMLLSDQPGILQLVEYYAAMFFISILATPLSAGLKRIHLKLSRSEQISFLDLFYLYRHHPDRYIIAELIKTLFALVALLPMIGATVFLVYNLSVVSLILFVFATILTCVLTLFIAILFFQVVYLLLDHPEYSAPTAFRQSAQMMKGSKGRCFYLLCSFIGWGCLYILSFGIGLLWIMPYMMQTYTTFYRNLCGELPGRTETTVEGVTLTLS